jgi:putative membrane protein (TIGR04086 family)
MHWTNNKPVKNPKALYWRATVYVLVALYCSWLIGNHYGDKGLVVGVAIGIVIILAMFAVSAFVIRQHLEWLRKHLDLLVGIFIALQLLLILLNLFQKH